MANTRFEEVESDLRHTARRALIALIVQEGEEAAELVLDQALGKVRRTEEADTAHALDHLPPYPEHAELNLAYAERRHQALQYARR